MSEVETDAVAEETQVPAAQISLQDFAAMVNVIDVVSARGAIKGDELQAVGTLRSRLTAFLEAAQPEQPEAEPVTDDLDDYEEQLIAEENDEADAADEDVAAV